MKRGLGILMALAIIMTGCQTTPKVDWQSRVGSYTFDQAVLDYGPPDKSATLTDGTTVSEWLTYRGRAGGTVITRGPLNGWVQYVETPSPDYFLRLTFDKTGKLQAWKKYAK